MAWGVELQGFLVREVGTTSTRAESCRQAPCKDDGAQISVTTATSTVSNPKNLVNALNYSHATTTTASATAIAAVTATATGRLLSL